MWNVQLPNITIFTVWMCNGVLVYWYNALYIWWLLPCYCKRHWKQKSIWSAALETFMAQLWRHELLCSAAWQITILSHSENVLRLEQTHQRCEFLHYFRVCCCKQKITETEYSNVWNFSTKHRPMSFLKKKKCFK